MDTLLEEYLKVLSSTMKKLGCHTKPPTMEDIKKSLKERAVVGLVSAATVLPIMLVDKNEALTVDEMLNAGDNYRNPGFKSKRYRETMMKRLPMFDQMGLFDLQL